MYLFTLQDITRFIYIYPVIVNFPCFLNLFGSFLFSFSSACFINYFYFKQLLTDLIDSKLVGTYTKDEEQVVKITSEGKNAYILTKDVLPGIMKLKADNIFKKEFSMIEEESSVIAEFTPRSENDYTIKCKIVENNETIFEVKTFAGSRDIAKRIVDNWNQNATTIYPKILNLLLNDEE